MGSGKPTWQPTHLPIRKDDLVVKSKGKNLHDAKKAKNDEFYTMWRDIENEMNAYRDYDENVFSDKVVQIGRASCRERV